MKPGGESAFSDFLLVPGLPEEELLAVLLNASAANALSLSCLKNKIGM